MGKTILQILKKVKIKSSKYGILNFIIDKFQKNIIQVKN
uniref:Uncharacterized protein n=1 Tax=viral metagenome TaxID=1070528 RepID=A0A6C0KXL5_9ZZZZ